MATTSYFEEALSPVDTDGKANPSSLMTTLEVLISSYSGEHRLYLKVTDPNGDERSFPLSHRQAVALHGGLERACHYLQYI